MNEEEIKINPYLFASFKFYNMYVKQTVINYR